MVCFGTRPEVIKLAPLISLLNATAEFSVLAVTTGQHREMLDQTLRTFHIRPDVDLRLMRHRQGLAELTSEAITALAGVMAEHRPDAVIVQGDTTTAMCAGLAAHYEGVPVGHVEAGLRTNDPRNPFPEETNRRILSVLARWHFCPTAQNAAALTRENVSLEAISVTGNTGIDALLEVARRNGTRARFVGHAQTRATRRILVTLHRRETQGEVHRELARMLGRVADREDVEILFPVHLSPRVRESVFAELRGHPRVHLVDPLDYEAFVEAMRDSYLVVTDSGGIQEEAPVFGLPVVVMRETTERWEGVEAGSVVLSGTDHRQVEADVLRLLDNLDEYTRRSQAVNPYGDGNASQRILVRLRHDLLGIETEVSEFAPVAKASS